MSCINMSKGFAAAVMLLVTGCGEPDRADRFLAETYPLDLRDPARVTEAARYSDPTVMMIAGVLDVTLMFAAFASGEPIGCFELIDHSDRAAGIADWRIEGNCTFRDEREMHESAGSIVGRGNTSGTRIEYRGFRSLASRPDDCGGALFGSALDGVVEVPYLLVPYGSGGEPRPEEPEPTGEGRYEVHLFHERWDVQGDESCEHTHTQVAYDATVDYRLEAMPDPEVDDSPGHSSGHSARQVRIAAYRRKLYDAEGRAAAHLETRASVEAPWAEVARSPGAWQLSARDYGLAQDDGACEHFVIGTLQLASGDDVAVLHPDAPTSCYESDDGSAEPACTRWSLNGEEQPDELCGFVWLMGCSAGPDARPPWEAIALVVAGLLWQHRRRRAAPTRDA